VDFFTEWAITLVSSHRFFLARLTAGTDRALLESTRVVRKVLYRLVSSEHVLDEYVTLIARRSHYAFAAQWGQDAMDSGIEWLRAGEEDWAKALVLMRKFADQGVSFTDCLSAVLMKRAGLKRGFGFDRHFEEMGFRVWPGQAD